MFSVQRFFSPPKRWPCQHINLKLFSRSSFAGRAVILEPLLGERFFVALSWFWAANLQKLVVFYVFQIARATLCGLWAGRALKTRGFLRFSNRSRDPLRSFARSNRSRCGAALIFLKLRTLNRCRASGICSRAFLAQARNRGRAIGIASEALLILRKLVFFLDFQFARATLCGVWAGRPLKTRGFLRFANRSCDPLRSFARSNRSRCGAALILMKLRDLNRCQVSGICTNAN